MEPESVQIMAADGSLWKAKRQGLSDFKEFRKWLRQRRLEDFHRWFMRHQPGTGKNRDEVDMEISYEQAARVIAEIQAKPITPIEEAYEAATVEGRVQRLLIALRPFNSGLTAARVEELFASGSDFAVLRRAGEAVWGEEVENVAGENPTRTEATPNESASGSPS